MNQTVGIILYITYNIIFIAFHVYRYDFYCDKKLDCIIYWGAQALIMLGIGAFVAFSFPECIVFCYTKMIFVTLIFGAVILIQLIILSITDYGHPVSIILTVFLTAILFIILLFNWVDNAFVKDETPIKTVTRRDILTAADNLTSKVSGETHGNLFYIYGYINSEEKMTYTYYYLSDDGKEAIPGKCNEDNTKIILINENEKPYIEVINTKYNYINMELKEPAQVTDDDIIDFKQDESTSYILYAPISAFNGKVELDAKWLIKSDIFIRLYFFLQIFVNFSKNTWHTCLKDVIYICKLALELFKC